MKSKFGAIFSGILALAIVAAPLTAQACGDKDKDNAESNLPEGSQSSFTIESDRFDS